MTMAAVKRASLKRIVGNASKKTNHKAICASVARTRAATPLYTAALQFTGQRIGRLLAIRGLSSAKVENVGLQNLTAT